MVKASEEAQQMMEEKKVVKTSAWGTRREKGEESFSLWRSQLGVWREELLCF